MRTSKATTITGWVLPDTVGYDTCTKNAAYDGDIDVPEVETVYVPDVHRLYVEYMQDNQKVECFDYMDRVITVAKNEQFIKVLNSGWENGSFCVKQFLQDLATPHIDTTIESWLQIIRADSLYGERDDLAQIARNPLSDHPVLDHNTYDEIPIKLLGLINRGRSDLILAMYIVYGMNYDKF